MIKIKLYDPKVSFHKKWWNEILSRFLLVPKGLFKPVLYKNTR